MANTDRAYGLRASRTLSGGCVSSNEYKIASAYGADIFDGDPVELAANGTIIISPAASVNAIGVFNGVQYLDSQGRQQFSKQWISGTVATEIKAAVFDNPDIIFSIQSDVTGVVDADVGAHADWEIVAGDATIGVSKTNLDASTALGATQAGLRVLRVIDNPENEQGAFSNVEVIFAQHAFNTSAAGV